MDLALLSLMGTLIVSSRGTQQSTEAHVRKHRRAVGPPDTKARGGRSPAFCQEPGPPGNSAPSP